MAVVTRGSWTIDHGVAACWEAAGLDNVFRSEWPDPNANYLPLNDGEARPETPHPYCVYEKSPPSIEEHHTGACGGGGFQQLQRVGIQFTVHAKSTASESGKNIAERMAIAVCGAFDPENGLLDISPDDHIMMFRGPDFHIREGDEEWAWICMYDLLIDATYNWAV